MSEITAQWPARLGINSEADPHKTGSKPVPGRGYAADRSGDDHRFGRPMTVGATLRGCPVSAQSYRGRPRGAAPTGPTRHPFGKTGKPGSAARRCGPNREGIEHTGSGGLISPTTKP